MLGIDLEAQTRTARSGAVAVLVGVVARAAPDVVAVASCTRETQGVIQGPVHASRSAHACFDLAGVVRAKSRAHGGRKGTLAFAREQLDHSTNGVRAIHCGGRATQHFDAIDLRQRNLLPHGAAGGLRVDAHTVDVHRCETAFSAAQKNIGRVTHATIAHDLYARQSGQHVDNAGRATVFEGFAVDHGNIGHQVRQRLLGACCRDNRFVHRWRVQVLRHQHRLGLLRKRGQRTSQRQGQSRRAKARRRSDTAHVGRGDRHEKTRQQKVTPADFPAGAWVITVAHTRKTSARNHIVGRYPGWRNALQSLPKRLFKALSGVCMERES